MNITYFSGSAYAQILSNIWRDIFLYINKPVSDNSPSYIQS